MSDVFGFGVGPRAAGEPRPGSRRGEPAGARSQSRREASLKIRIESASRWDALALTRSLGRYRWYLVEPDEKHWDVYVELDDAPPELPEDLRDRIDRWVDERRLDAVTIHAGESDLTLSR
jgi:hypothetical protein